MQFAMIMQSFKNVYLIFFRFTVRLVGSELFLGLQIVQ